MLFSQHLSKQPISICQVLENGDLLWGDYDNDSDLDILITGESVDGPITKIYRNDGVNGFSENEQVVFLD